MEARELSILPDTENSRVNLIAREKELRQKVGLSPIRRDEIKSRSDKQFNSIEKHKVVYNSYSRGIEEYLRDEKTYAILPGYGGFSAEELIKDLPEGSNILDVACGDGNFLKLVNSINNGISAYGYDGVERDMKISKGSFRMGNIDELSPEKYGGMQFDIVTNVATSYHVPSFFGSGLEAMTSMVKPGGHLLISSLPRTVRMLLYITTDSETMSQTIIEDKLGMKQELIEDQNGKMTKLSESFETVDGYILAMVNESWAKGTCAGVFRPDGTIVTPSEYFSFLEEESNGGFDFEYSVGKSSEGQSPLYDGKLAVKKLKSDAELNLKNVFYAKMEIEELPKKHHLSERSAYIIAETPEKANELREDGFLSVAELVQEKSKLQVVEKDIVSFKS